MTAIIFKREKRRFCLKKMNGELSIKKSKGKGDVLLMLLLLQPNGASQQMIHQGTLAGNINKNGQPFNGSPFLFKRKMRRFIVRGGHGGKSRAHGKPHHCAVCVTGRSLRFLRGAVYHHLFSTVLYRFRSGHARRRCR